VRCADGNAEFADARDAMCALLQEDELGGETEEMHFALPAAPSPAAQEALLAAGREVARAGGHSLGAGAVALLCWELGDAVLQAFRSGCFWILTRGCWQLRVVERPPGNVAHPQ
jgi:hypothetical protein